MTDRHYRTEPGDEIRDPITGQARIVVSIWRADDIHRFVDGHCYRRRHSDERSALHTGRRRGPMPPQY